MEYYSAANDTASIVSIRVQSTLQDDKPWFNKSELARIFKAMTENRSASFEQNDQALAAQICYIGQPVLISPTEAVLRIALGSDSLRSYIEDREATIEEDK